MFSLRTVVSGVSQAPMFRPMRSIYFWLFIWLGLFGVYLCLLHVNLHSVVANHIAYYSQEFTDIAIGISCFIAYKVAIQKDVKLFLRWVFISMIIGLYSNEMYNLIFHFIKIKTTSPLLNLIWLVPYTIFLVIQIVSWYRLIQSKETTFSLKKTWFTALCFVQAPLIVLSAVLVANFLKTTTLSIYGVIQVANTVLEIALFFIVAIVLARSKKQWLSCLASGILLLIMFNMTHRFSYAGGYFNKVFDVAWLVCFIFVVFGFVYFIFDEKKNAEFHDQKSLFVLTSALFLATTTIMLFVFSFMEIFISNFIEMAPLSYLNHLLANIPGILIFSYMVAVFLAKFVSVYVLKSINMISQRVDFIQNDQRSDNSPVKHAQEISEVKKLDDFITSTIKSLYEANQAKSDFLVNMSHDFRTPVSGISSMSQFIFEKLEDKKIKELQKLVVDSSGQLMEIIDQILGYYQLLHSQKPFVSEKVDVVRLIDDMVAFMSAKAEEKKLVVSTCYSDAPIYCAADRVMLHRVLLNVFSNAIKFTEKGRVEVRVENKVVGDSHNVVIEIEDSGIGMEASQLNVIFEPFYQVESPFTAKYAGIGLGLSHVKLIVEKLNGSVTVFSTPGTGATFRLVFPAFL